MAKRVPDDEKIANLSDALRWLREGQRLRQADLAGASGVSQVYVGQIERGTSYPSHDALAKIETALGVDRAYVEEVAKNRPWEMLPYATSSAEPPLADTDVLAVAAFADASYIAPQRSSMRVRRSISKAALGAIEVQNMDVQALASSHSLVSSGMPLARTAETPVDSDSAELMAIYKRLGRPDQLTLLGVARSLGRHLP